MDAEAQRQLEAASAAVADCEAALKALDALTAQRGDWESRLAKVKADEEAALADHSLTEKQATAQLAETDRLGRVLQKRFEAYKQQCAKAASDAYELGAVATERCNWLGQHLMSWRKVEAGKALDSVLADYRLAPRSGLVNHARGVIEARRLAGRFQPLPALSTPYAKANLPALIESLRDLGRRFADLKSAIEAEEGFRPGVTFLELPELPVRPPAAPAAAETEPEPAEAAV